MSITSFTALSSFSSLASINNFNPAQEAIIDKRFEVMVDGLNPGIDSSSNIILTSYKSNELIYEFSTAIKQLAVFSEIYYPKGWNAYIDGELKNHFRVNYILRAMVLPAGDHELVFRFEPESYRIGNKISLAGSIILILSIIMVLFYTIRKKGSVE